MKLADLEEQGYMEGCWINQRQALPVDLHAVSQLAAQGEVDRRCFLPGLGGVMGLNRQ